MTDQELMEQYSHPIDNTGTSAEKKSANVAAPSSMSDEELMANYSENLPKQYGSLEAFTTNLGQGATLGFGDEIVAGAKAILNKKNDKSFKELYDQYLQENRDALKQMDEQQYVSSLAGNLLGGAVLPVGGIAKGGATIANLAKQGAKYGGIAALGSSEAGVLEDPTQTLKDVGYGAATGAVLSPILGKTVEMFTNPNRISKSNIAETPRQALKRGFEGVNYFSDAGEDVVIKNLKEGSDDIVNRLVGENSPNKVTSELYEKIFDPIAKTRNIAPSSPLTPIIDEALENSGLIRRKPLDPKNIAVEFGDMYSGASSGPIKLIRDVASRYDNGELSLQEMKDFVKFLKGKKVPGQYKFGEGTRASQVLEDVDFSKLSQNPVFGQEVDALSEVLNKALKTQADQLTGGKYSQVNKAFAQAREGGTDELLKSSYIRDNAGTSSFNIREVKEDLDEALRKYFEKLVDPAGGTKYNARESLKGIVNNFERFKQELAKNPAPEFQEAAKKLENFKPEELYKKIQEISTDRVLYDKVLGDSEHGKLSIIDKILNMAGYGGLNAAGNITRVVSAPSRYISNKAMQWSNILKNKPGTAHLGKALEKAYENPLSPAFKATLFAISQNKDAREMLPDFVLDVGKSIAGVEQE